MCDRDNSMSQVILTWALIGDFLELMFTLEYTSDLPQAVSFKVIRYFIYSPENNLCFFHLDNKIVAITKHFLTNFIVTQKSYAHNFEYKSLFIG